jgi:hypothetical protein
MGCFGYICKGCRTPINGSCRDGGEKCILIHVRKGIELGRCEGHYDEYGTVIEEDGKPLGFRNETKGDINSHDEMCNSEFSGDSMSGIVAWHSLCYNKASEEEKSNLTPSEQDPNQSWGKIRKKFL